MDIDPNDPRIPSRPLWGLAILALPLIGLVVVATAYLGMFVLGTRGRPASGEEVALWYEVPADCGGADAGAEAVTSFVAAEVVEARLGDMGLKATALPAPAGAPAFGFSVAMPADAAVAATIPSTLARPGLARLMGGEQLLADNSDIADASIRMDLLMQPSLLLRLDPDAAERVRSFVRGDPQGKITLLVDGEAVASQRNDRPVQVGEVELTPDDEAMDEQARWAALAELSVTVDHPLACALLPKPAAP